MWVAHLWLGSACGQVLSGVFIGVSPQSSIESVGYHGLGTVFLCSWLQSRAASGLWLSGLCSTGSPLTSISSLLCLHRAGKPAGLLCLQGSAHSHPPTAITGQCSCVTALQCGEKCPKSHFLLICHLKSACCPWQGHLDLSSYSRHDSSGSAAHGEICLPADLPAPLAHTAHGNWARLWKARAGWQQQ